jgi:hypothetical protein
MSKGATWQVCCGSYSSLDAGERAETEKIRSIGLNEAVIDSVLSNEAVAPPSNTSAIQESPNIKHQYPNKFQFPMTKSRIKN